MAYAATQNIDPALRQKSLSSPPKPRENGRNGGNAPPQTSQPQFSPLQTSPSHNQPYQNMPPTPTYYNNNGTQQMQDSPEEASPTGNPSDPNDLKRPRACEACRQLKVKCEFDEAKSVDTCKRCAKAGRQCVVTAPSRKRQKKTDSRVAELEKKIDALTATLAQKGGEPELEHGMPHSGPPPPQPHRADIYPEDWSSQLPPPPATQASPAPTHGVKRRLPNDHDYFGGELHKSAASSSYRSVASTQPYPPMYVKPEPEEPPVLDAISQNILDVHTAKRCFDRYTSETCYHLPIVVFPPGTTFEDLRQSKPLLCSSAVAVAAGTIRPDLQSRLIGEVTKVLADKIVVRGEKSLEIVQTIQCITTFYQPPEKYEELNFNQLIHIAAVMALDIGMGKRFKKGNLALWRPYSDAKRSLPEPNSAETRRCWLGCYYMCSNSSMSLRRPLLVRWSPYADECIEILTKSPDAAPTDKWLCLLVRAQHISEAIGLEFSMDDPASQLSLTDHKTQYHLKAFERQLAEWKDSATPEMLQKPILHHTHGIINLYMHEIAMHHNHNIDDFRPPFNKTPIDGPSDPDFVTPAHIESLTVCMNSVHEVFEAFLSMDTNLLRALPTLFFVRNAYAAVALIKMYTAVSAKGSKFGSIIKTDDLKVDYYVDRLIGALSETARGGQCKVAAKFSLIFNMLKSWHVRRADPDNSSNPTSRTRTPLGGPRGMPAQQYKPPAPHQDPASLGWNSHHGRSDLAQHHPSNMQSRNGLQMLSEAAMGPAPQQQPNPQNQHAGAQSQNISPSPQQNQLPAPWLQAPQQPHLQQQQQHQQHQQQPQQNQSMPQQQMPGVNEIGGFNPYMGMEDSMGNMDLDLMAYGFGDEFLAMGFGMGIEQGGWAF